MVEVREVHPDQARPGEVGVLYVAAAEVDPVYDGIREDRLVRLHLGHHRVTEVPSREVGFLELGEVEVRAPGDGVSEARFPRTHFRHDRVREVGTAQVRLRQVRSRSAAINQASTKSVFRATASRSRQSLRSALVKSARETSIAVSVRRRRS